MCAKCSKRNFQVWYDGGENEDVGQERKKEDLVETNPGRGKEFVWDEGFGSYVDNKEFAEDEVFGQVLEKFIQNDLAKQSIHHSSVNTWTQ